MPAQAGKDLLLKLDRNDLGTFESVAGLRSKKIALNARSVDVTTTDSAGGWREILEGAGVRSASISGSGIFKDSNADALVREVFFAGLNRPWQIIIPSFGTVSGLFHLAALEYAGEFAGELTYELALESAGPVTFTPQVV
ncbi:phage major tail protein, TP901-1 family [Rhodobacteraceae bacterium RKSG542]|uniref:phage major tail protein, TP901-1 family n=1 Tax=Pseudovibrio flavus TaxID=2529854 RepID=UPI0012BD530F|nr:phage major tail protein, TP901-1 family [Pseudovibrio flavus]MTI17058.1 phage major tail protein, TP901-1 family [Pseudovibrio flavus]